MSDFDEIINRYNTGSYKYDRIKALYPSANEDTIVMTLADMDFRVSKEIREYLSNIALTGIYGYMTENYKPFHDAIIKRYKRYYDLDINDSEIIFSNGTVGAIKALIEKFTNVNDKIVLSRPIYGHFTEAIESINREVLDVHLKDNKLDFDGIKESLKDEQAKIYLLCSPHNPCGIVYSSDDLRRLIDICHETNTILISDEVHADIIRKDKEFFPILSVGNNFKNIIMITSPGKTFNMSGLQCSIIIIKDEILRDKFRESFDNDISTFALHGAIAAYNMGDKYVCDLNKYIDSNIDFAIEYIKNNMKYVDVFKPDGTYFLWLDFKNTKLTKEEIHEIIYKRANVILQDGVIHDPLYGGFFQRMMVCYPKEVIREALLRIDNAFKEYMNEKNI